ncbi:hypothetical protein J3B02_000171 [Coemansia erecta]|nr:hypothetical protein J3B02_000171 [Coemansia erecta]
MFRLCKTTYSRSPTAEHIAQTLKRRRGLQKQRPITDIGLPATILRFSTSSTQALDRSGIAPGPAPALGSATQKATLAQVTQCQPQSNAYKQPDQSLPALSDLFGRFHNYLRISVTERCNLRCQYCMPEEGIELTENDKLMTTAEIIRLARIFVGQGVDKIRLTGGEPTVRKDILDLISGLNELRPLGLKKIAMTTNGISLRRKLPHLRKAGLDGLNISLDTRDPRKFELFTRRQGSRHVLQAISEAGKLGFDFVKVNVVVMRGMNDDEVPAFVEMTHDESIDVRFIEYMPFDGNQWGRKKLVGYRDMLTNLYRIYGDNIERLPLENNHTAKGYRIKGYRGQFGFITSMTDSFCSACNRVRVMADGNLKVCLFGNTEVELLDLLRGGASNAEIVDTIIRTKSSLTHVDESGDAHMVDVSDKMPTPRSAIARGQVRMNRETLELIKQDGIKKGNVIAVAQIAGITGAKNCSQIIPLCHPINISKVSVKFDLVERAYEEPLCCAVNIEAQVKCKGETGVEMEALSAVSIAALTVFDMCKAVSKNMRIENIRVVEKTGGKSGNWKLDN